MRFKILFLLLFLLLFNTTALCQEDLFEHAYSKYSGWEGLNNRGLDIGIKPTELSYIRNGHYDDFPFVTKREGYDKVNEYQIASDRIRGLFSFYKANGTKYLLTVTNSAVYKNTSGCMTQLKSGLTILDIEYDGVTFEDNGQVYKLICERSSKRPRNPIVSEALETPSDVIKMWQGPYYDFFGHPPTPSNMDLVAVDIVDRHGDLLHFSQDDPLILT